MLQQVIDNVSTRLKDCIEKKSAHLARLFFTNKKIKSALLFISNTDMFNVILMFFPKYRNRKSFRFTANSICEVKT